MGDGTRLRSLYFETIGSILHHLAHAAVVIFTIVNNENILTDGTDERKYLPKKYNDL